MYKDHTQNNDDDIMKKIVTNQIIKSVTVDVHSINNIPVHT